MKSRVKETSMDKIVVQGGDNRLVGSVTIEGAKNAVLPLLAATILASEGKTVLQNVPILSDVFIMNQVVGGLNAKVDFDEEAHLVKVDATGDITEEAPYKYVSKMRASIVVLGPILARVGHAKVSMPGGCTIGSRPIDLHLKGLEAMGVKISQTAGYIEAKAERLHGAHIYMDFPSVGATQNLMMAATLADGVTVIENAAREPEIVDLAILLNEMGAKVKGAGTETITITGVEVIEEDEGIRVRSQLENLKAVHVKTLPHPGFPTDMQAQFTALMTVAKGESTMVETVFENRFQHLEEMRRMGLHSEIIRDTARIVGGQPLQGAEVLSTDLRASAALILTGLVAQGETVVGKLVHLDRGYYGFHEKLAQLGAKIQRIEASDEDE